MYFSFYLFTSPVLCFFVPVADVWNYFASKRVSPWLLILPLVSIRYIHNIIHDDSDNDDDDDDNVQTKCDL